MLIDGRKAMVYAFMITACIIFSFIPASSNTISILPDVHPVKPGEEFVFHIYIEPKEEIYGIQLDLVYDNSSMSVLNIREGDFFTYSESAFVFNPGKVLNQEGVVSDIYGFVVMGNGTKEDGVFFTVTAVTKKNESTFNLRVLNPVIAGESGKELPFSSYNALVEIDSSKNDLESNINRVKKDLSEPEITVPKNKDIHTTTEIVESSDSIDNEDTLSAMTHDINEDKDTSIQASQQTSESATDFIKLLSIAIFFLLVAYILDGKNKK